MSGIIGYIGGRSAPTIIVEALKRLEYRGYDSAGLAILSDGGIAVKKELGGVKNLEGSLRKDPLTGSVGIGHTRWATHGKVSKENAHPQVAGEVALVHNGIVENYIELKEGLEKKGHKFKSETDSEVVAHLIQEYFEGDLEKAVVASLKDLKGTYALVAISSSDPDKIVVATKENPIVIGLGAGEFFAVSDVTTFLPYTKDAIFLKDEHLAVITREGVQIRSRDGKSVTEKIKRITWNPVMIEKGGYRHFYLKEVCEQPRTVRETVEEAVPRHSREISFSNFSFENWSPKSLKRVLLTGCGSTWNTALIGKQLIEEISKVPSEAEMSSELRSRASKMPRGTLMVGISQSGETVDTIACVKKAAKEGARTLALTNSYSSILSREAQGGIPILAGPEISVASTKSFTGSIAALYLLAIYIGRMKETVSEGEAEMLLEEIAGLPSKIEKVIELEGSIENLSRVFYEKKGFLYLARGINFPIAYEGAMKMKELAYIYAQGYPGGEMKHGPIALIDKQTPVVVLLPKDRNYQKSLNDAEEVKARGGEVILFASEGDNELKKRFEHVFFIPRASYFLNPILFVVPLQLFAYYVALRRGADVDRPRNLAKSVTVD